MNFTVIHFKITFRIHSLATKDIQAQESREKGRTDQLKEYTMITPDLVNYTLIVPVTDSFGPIILQVEAEETVSIDELSLVLTRRYLQSY